jgi:hypothetical protein
VIEQDDRFGRNAVPADLLRNLISGVYPTIRELIYCRAAIEVFSCDQPGGVSFGDDVGFLDVRNRFAAAVLAAGVIS